MPVTTRSASKKTLTASVVTQSKFNEIQGNMRLRSGKVLSGCKEPVQETTYNLSAVVSTTPRHYNAVRKQEIAELEKAVDKVIYVLNSYVVAFNETDHYVCDSVMEKIRLVAMMFAYANSIPTPTMMHHRLEKLRTVMLKLCVKFSEQAKEKIDIRIKAAMEIMPERNPKRYYTAQLEDMQDQLDKFTKTYALRL